VILRKTAAAAAILMALLSAAPAARSEEPVETIVLIRHGEKPEKGLGQLNCRGLNRALALPSVIAKDFGRPSAIFAPNPSHEKDDDGVPYDYVRPLVTVEPTAILFGLPVNAKFGYADIAGLQAAIEQPAYRNAVILIAWEHHYAEDMARALLAAHGGDPSVVPKWRRDDFDSIYVVTIGAAKANFSHRREDLDGQPDACPR
jgi:hypothetical protein